MQRENRLRQRLAAGEPCFGAFVNFPSPHAVEICGIAGLDFVIVDAEHGPMDPHSGEEMVRAAGLVDLTPIVRVMPSHRQEMLRYLDVGVLGVQLPILTSSQDAEQAAVAVRLHAEGRRGPAGTPAAGAGVGPRLSDRVVEASQPTIVIVQVETTQAVEALPRILEIEDVDVVFIGPIDLSQSMGFPGRPHEPAVQTVVDRCVAQVRGAGKPVGTTCRDGAHARQLVDRGITYLCASVGALLAQSVRGYLRDGRGR